MKLRYFTPEEQQAEKDAEARGKQERQQREEAERVQRIRENFVRKSDCFENLYYYLEEYRYQKANRRTACETVADHMDTLLEGRNYTLPQREIGYLLRICGVMAADQAMRLVEIQNYITKVKEAVENDSTNENGTVSRSNHDSTNQDDTQNEEAAVRPALAS